MFKKVIASIALATGLVLVAAPAQAATSPDVVGMSEQDAYDYLTERNIPYRVLQKQYFGDDCYVSYQGSEEHVVWSFLRYMGSLGASTGTPRTVTLIVSCV